MKWVLWSLPEPEKKGKRGLTPHLKETWSECPERDWAQQLRMTRLQEDKGQTPTVGKPSPLTIWCPLPKLGTGRLVPQ